MVILLRLVRLFGYTLSMRHLVPSYSWVYLASPTRWGGRMRLQVISGTRNRCSVAE